MNQKPKPLMSAEDLEYRAKSLRQWAAKFDELAAKMREMSAEIEESGSAQFESSIRIPLEANINRIRGRIEKEQSSRDAQAFKPQKLAMVAEQPTEFVVDKPKANQSKKGKPQQ
jgi:hypothetical protein